MPQIRLQRASIGALIGQRKPTGMAQHVGVNFKAEASSLTGTAYSAGKPCGGERCATHAGKDVGTKMVLVKRLNDLPLETWVNEGRTFAAAVRAQRER